MKLRILERTRTNGVEYRHGDIVEVSPDVALQLLTTQRAEICETLPIQKMQRAMMRREKHKRTTQ